MILKRGFKTDEVARLTGLTPRQLDHWDRTGFIRPSISPARGRGSSRLYSFTDVVQLRVAKELRDAGVTLQSLRGVVERLRRYEGLENPLAETRLIVRGGDVLVVHGGEGVSSALRFPGQGVLSFVVDISGVVEELRREARLVQGKLTCAVSVQQRQGEESAGGRA